MSLLRPNIIQDDTTTGKFGWCPNNYTTVQNYFNAVQSGLAMNAMPTPLARIEVVKQAFEYIAHYDFTQAGHAYQQLISDTLDIIEILFNYNLYKQSISISYVKLTDLNYPHCNSITANGRKQDVSFFEESIKESSRCNGFYIVSYNGDGQHYALAISSPDTLFIPSCRLDREKGKPNGYGLKIGRLNGIGGGGYFFDSPKGLTERDKDFQDYLYHLIAENRDALGATAFGKYIISELGANKADNFKNEIKSDLLKDNTSTPVNIPLSNITGGKNVQLLVSLKPSSKSIIHNKIVNIGYDINPTRFQVIKNYGSCLLPVNLDQLAQTVDHDIINNIQRHVHDISLGEYNAFVKESKAKDIAPFDIGIYPFFKYPDGCIHSRVATYNIILAYEFKNYLDNGAIDLQFYEDSGNEINRIPTFSRQVFNDTKNGISKGVIKEIRTDQKSSGANMRTIHYTVVGTNFDYIEVIFRFPDLSAKGVLKPNFTQCQVNNSEVTFAVDFGTTSTFVAIKESGNAPTGLSTDEQSMVMLHHPEIINQSPVFKYEQYSSSNSSTSNSRDDNADAIPRLVEIIKNEFIPTSIGDTFYKFPIRTAISQVTSGRADSMFEDSNIAFTYNKEQAAGDNIFTSNIKWDSDKLSNTSLFIREIIRICMIHAISKGYKADNIHFQYFYPLSMNADTLAIINDTWADGCREYGISESNLYAMTESLAPYYASRKDDASCILSIDIGGGSVDSVVYKDNEPILAVSALFGCDVLWGSGKIAAANDKSNSIFINLKNIIDENIAVYKSDSGLWEILQQICSPGSKSSSVEIINFLLDNNEYFKTDEKLRRTKYHPIYVSHFYALLYHLAQTMKLKKIPIPSEISLSGNGSNYLRYISGYLHNIAKAAFIDVYGKDSLTNEIKITLPEKGQGKKMTAYGGLNATQYTNIKPDINNLKFIYLGEGIGAYSTSHENAAEIINAGRLSEDIVNQICENVMRMERGLSVLLESLSLDYGPFASSKEEHRTTLKEGVENSKLYIGAKRVESTLFFVPVRQMIYKLEKSTLLEK